MLFDDVHQIIDNPGIKNFWPPSGLIGGHSRHVVGFTLAMNYAISGLKPWSYHAFNLLVHLLAGLTLMGVIRRTILLACREPESTLRTMASGVAFCGAMIWLVHPLQTQSVTYIIQRCESMMGLFYLLTLYCYVRGVEAARPWPWYLASIAACTLGMGCKEVMATAPLMVVLCELLFVSKDWRETVRRRWWLYLGLFAAWIYFLVTGVFRSVLQARLVGLVSGGMKSDQIDQWEYARTQLAVVAHYLKLAFWPVNQCLDYGWEPTQSMREVAGPAILMTALVLGTLWALVRRSLMGFWAAWFFIILSVTSSVMPIEDRAFEHRMYLPLAGVVMVSILVGFGLLDRFSRPATIARAGSVLATGIVVALGITTVLRNTKYYSTLAMWEDNVAKRPKNLRVRASLAKALQENGRLDEAIENNLLVLSALPNHASAHSNLCEALLSKGRYAEALEHGEAVVRLTPQLPEGHNQLGRALAAKGRFAEACDEFQKALKLRPGFARAYYNLGRAQIMLHQHEHAAESFRAALAIDPTLAFVYRDQARLAIQNGDKAAALSILETGLKNCPRDFDLRFNYAVALHEAGRLDEAIQLYQEALRSRPNHAVAHNALGSALLSLARIDAAGAEFREALRLQPNLLEAHYNLGLVAERQGHRAEADEHFRAVLKIDPNNAAARHKLGM